MKPIRTETYDFYSTPGHGYLLVPYQHLIDANCADKITHFSRMQERSLIPETVYLEEDCDAPLFIKNAEQLGWEISTKCEYLDYDEFDIDHYKQYRRPFILLSPDGFSLQREPTIYTNFVDAKEAINQWMTRYQSQGYYSSTKHGRIAYDQIGDFVSWQEVDPEPEETDLPEDFTTPF